VLSPASLSGSLGLIGLSTAPKVKTPGEVVVVVVVGWTSFNQPLFYFIMKIIIMQKLIKLLFSFISLLLSFQRMYCSSWLSLLAASDSFSSFSSQFYSFPT
jgi:hypothetical protein